MHESSKGEVSSRLYGEPKPFFVHLLLLDRLPAEVEVLGHGLPALVVVQVELIADALAPFSYRQAQRALEHERLRE